MEIGKSFAQLSSGSRITKSSDDAAGLAISENLKSQIRGFQQASRNAGDGISMIQTAEGGLNEVNNILVRFRELGVQAASDSVGDEERGFINKEVQQLKQEADRIAKSTRFGKTQLIDGSGGTFDYQVGVNNEEGVDRISLDVSKISATTDALGLSSIDFSTKEGAQDALESLDKAENVVNGHRSTLGAMQSRLNSTTSNLGIAVENLSAANSRIRDTDIAESSSALTRNQIMLNASTAILAQANAAPQAALKLL
jgi:flagellin